MHVPVAVLDDVPGRAPPDRVDENRTTDRLRAEDRRPRRVALVVDDSDDARDFCRDVLEDEGYFVKTALDGQDALDLLIAMPTPAVIVLDVLMPKMSGLELLDIIRSYRRLAEVPVVVITAADGLEAIDDAHTICLKKPIDCSRLARTIQFLLDSSGD